MSKDADISNNKISDEVSLRSVIEAMISPPSIHQITLLHEKYQHQGLVMYIYNTKMMKHCILHP
jgi:hypothetical protein